LDVYEKRNLFIFRSLIRVLGLFKEKKIGVYCSLLLGGRRSGLVQQNKYSQFGRAKYTFGQGVENYNGRQGSSWKNGFVFSLWGLDKKEKCLRNSVWCAIHDFFADFLRRIYGSL